MFLDICTGIFWKWYDNSTPLAYKILFTKYSYKIKKTKDLNLPTQRKQEYYPIPKAVRRIVVFACFVSYVIIPKL